MIHTHTIVVRYPEGASPGYMSDTKINGGELVAVDFDGNRLRVAQELEEALENLLIVAPYDTPEEYNYWAQAKEALAKAQNLSRGEMEA